MNQAISKDFSGSTHVHFYLWKPDNLLKHLNYKLLPKTKYLHYTVKKKLNIPRLSCADLHIRRYVAEKGKYEVNKNGDFEPK